MSGARFVAGPAGVDDTGEPEAPEPEVPEPNDDDRWRAKLLVEGAGGAFAPETVDFFAQGIAVARTGGDVRAWIRKQAGR